MTDNEILKKIEILGSKYILALVNKGDINKTQANRIQEYRRKTGL